MAYAILSDYRLRAASPESLIARVRQGVADYRLYLSTVAELAELSDRDLSDLGIHRSMIRDIARQAVYG